MEKAGIRNFVIPIIFIFIFIILESLFYLYSVDDVFASDSFTVNTSTQTGKSGTEIVATYVPFLSDSNNCGGVQACQNHGKNAISAWINGTAFSTGSLESKFVPSFGNTSDSGYKINSVFGVGMGMPSAWLTTLKSSPENAESPITAPSLEERNQWVDQIVIGYTASNSSPFAQNFRSQLTFGTSVDPISGEITRDPDCTANISICSALLDQRLEQGDPDMEDKVNNSDNQNIKNAFQQSFAGISGPNLRADPRNGMTPDACVQTPGQDYGCAQKIGQNIEQTAEGFFYSCLNCNQNNEHAFTTPEKLNFQTWSTRPKITVIKHADITSQTTWIP